MILTVAINNEDFKRPHLDKLEEDIFHFKQATYCGQVHIPYRIDKWEQFETWQTFFRLVTFERQPYLVGGI